MSQISPSFARSTMLMQNQQLLGHLNRNQMQLADVQRQLSSGERYSRPSEGTRDAAAMLYLQNQIVSHAQTKRNLEHGQSVLNNLDDAMGAIYDKLIEAHSIALSESDTGADAGSRQAAAVEVQSQIDSLIREGNRQHQGISLFGGRTGQAEGPVFESFLGGVRYRGDEQALNLAGLGGQSHPFNSNGADAFDALSTRIRSDNDLNVTANADTRLRELGGALHEGVDRGHVHLRVNGEAVEVDLSDAEKIDDVLKRVNAAIESIDDTAGELRFNGDHFELEAGGGHQITIEDSSRTARDLGIDLSANGSTEAGQNVNPLLSDDTPLSNLDGGIDWTSGLEITHGEVTKTADFSSAQTIADLKHEIDNLDLGIRLEIDPANNNLQLRSQVSGPRLSVGENGGSTASDLGLRTLDRNTALDDFRDGRGIKTDEGQNDLRFTLGNGDSFDVNLDGSQTVQDVIDRIEDAASAAGAGLTVSMAATGNGLILEDTSGGGTFRIENLNQSQAATHLGIAQESDAGQINSGDQAQVRVEGVFTSLLDLRDSLEANDPSGIAFAGERLEANQQTVETTRARLATQSRNVQEAKERLEDRELMDETMLSNLKDADIAELVTRLAQLQLQSQATMQSAAQQMQLSLMDFLR